MTLSTPSINPVPRSCPEAAAEDCCDDDDEDDAESRLETADKAVETKSVTELSSPRSRSDEVRFFSIDTAVSRVLTSISAGSTKLVVASSRAVEVLALSRPFVRDSWLKIDRKRR